MPELHFFAASSTAATLDVPAILTSIATVLIVSILFGAGVPALFAAGVKATAAGSASVRALGYAVYVLCALLVVFAVLSIFFGSTWFGK